MANSKIEITLISIPSLNQYIKFKVNGVQTTETYKVARTTNFEVLRSADTVIENMANYISAFNLDYNITGDFIINLIIGETVYIKIESTLSTVNFSLGHFSLGKFSKHME